MPDPQFEAVDHDPFMENVDISQVILLRDPLEQQKAAIHTYARALAPGLYDYLTKPAPPSNLEVPRGYVGKIPRNPAVGAREAAALEDLRNLGMMAIPGGELEAGTARALSAIREAGAGAVNAIAPPAYGADNRTNVAAIPSSPSAELRPPAVPSGSIRPAFTADDLARMNQLQTDITNLTARRVAATKDIGPKKAAIEGKVYDDQIQAKQDEITRMRADMLNRQSVFDMATQPIAVRNADAVAQARAAAMGLSGATGALHGLAHRPGLRPWIQSGVLGGLEGSLGVIGPNLYDLGAPKGTPAREAAERNLAFLSHPLDPGAWEYAQNVIAPEFAGGAGIGTVGHYTGNAISSGAGAVVRGVRSLFGGGPSPTSPLSSTQAFPTTAMPRLGVGGGAWPDDPRQIKMFKDAAGKYREQGTGRFVPKQYWPSK